MISHLHISTYSKRNNKLKKSKTILLRMVPPLREWILTAWDINKDIPVTDMLQLSAPNIQLKEASRVFRLYIKSLGDKAVYRVEESVEMQSSVVDALHTTIRTIPSQDYTKYIRDPEMNLLTDIHDDWG